MIRDAFDAVVLAGGEARRLGGTHKPEVRVGDRTLLDRTLEACAGASSIVCVGPTVATYTPVTWCREDPPGGGPVAGLAAAVPHLRCSLVLVLACDMPFVADALPALLTSARARIGPPGGDQGVVLAAGGRRQLLAGVYGRQALVGALERMPTGAITGAGEGDRDGRGHSVRSTLGGLRLAEMSVDSAATTDCDTWADVERARRSAHLSR